MHQLNDTEYRVVQLKRRIAELKEKIGYTSSSVKLDPQTATPKNSNPVPANRNVDALKTYNSQRASESDNLKNQLRKRT